MDSSDADMRQAVRRPTQERGQRRFDAILDAAAQILVEDGVARFTMHGVAARAKTSIGSLYHFFPDGGSLLRALGERHLAALATVFAELRRMDDAAWTTPPLRRAVGLILDPLLSYMVGHPDLFELARDKPQRDEDDGQELDQTSIALFQRFIAARTPAAPASDILLRARTMHAIVEGVAMRAANYAVAERPALFVELRVAISAYLGAYEGAYENAHEGAQERLHVGDD